MFNVCIPVSCTDKTDRPCYLTEVSFKVALNIHNPTDVYYDGILSCSYHLITVSNISGADPGGQRPPLKLEKNMIFWRKIVIFHTKYPNNFPLSLRSAQFFKCPPHPYLEILDPPLHSYVLWLIRVPWYEYKLGYC